MRDIKKKFKNKRRMIIWIKLLYLVIKIQTQIQFALQWHLANLRSKLGEEVEATRLGELNKRNRIRI